VQKRPFFFGKFCVAGIPQLERQRMGVQAFAKQRFGALRKAARCLRFRPRFEARYANWGALQNAGLPKYVLKAFSNGVL
jgi:hypothetical protein